MAFISTFGTFSVRGFGVGGTAPISVGLAHIGYTSGVIYDLLIDNDNNLIGIFDPIGTSGIPHGGTYLFKYSKDVQLTYWTFQNTESRSFALAQNSTGNIFGAGSVFLTGAGSQHGTLTSYGTGTALWATRYNYFIGSPFSSGPLPNFSYVAINDTDVLGMGVDSTTPSRRRTWFVRTDLSGNLQSMFYFTYNIGGTGATPYLFNGKCVAMESLAGAGFGVFSATYNNIAYKISSTTFVRRIFDTSTNFAYVATSIPSGGNTFIGIARIAKDTLTIANSFTFSTTGTTNTVTGFTVDTVNSFIYISYTNAGETSVDRITKFTLAGVPIWTRTLKQGSGVALGITKLVTSPDGERYYIVTQGDIFEFPADGSIPNTGIYIVDGITYTYASTGAAWVNGTTNNLVFSGSTLNEGFSLPTTTPSTALTVATTPATPQITWSTIT